VVIVDLLFFLTSGVMAPGIGRGPPSMTSPGETRWRSHVLTADASSDGLGPNLSADTADIINPTSDLGKKDPVPACCL
jgi:hypothetical protein